MFLCIGYVTVAPQETIKVLSSYNFDRIFILQINMVTTNEGILAILQMDEMVFMQSSGLSVGCPATNESQHI